MLRNEIASAQKRYKEQKDKRLTPHPDWKIGDRVMVSAKNIKSTRPTKKFSEKYLGPFEIIAQPSTVAFTLRLPPELRSIHPVFHVSQLESILPNPIPNRIQDPPGPIEVEDSEDHYEISEILDSKLDRQFRCKLQYYVRWLGYEGTDEEFSWIPADNSRGDEIISDFHTKYPQKPGPLTSL